MAKPINKIFDFINSMLNKARGPLQAIPSIILVCSAINRPGLSAMLIASNIIRRQSEAGAPSGLAKDGGANIAEAMERIRVEEIIKAIKMDAKIQVGIPIGGIQFTGTGANMGGPVVVTGFNINSPYGIGLIG